MDRAHWTSPSFRGRSPHPRHSHPRFRGEGNSFGTPRHFSPHWQQRSPSPYRFQNQQGHGGSFNPNYHQGHHPYATSTPLHGSGGGRRPFFRGGGGGGRFNKRQSFGSPSFGKGGTSGNDLDSWISPEMWADPWRHLSTSSTLSTTPFSNVTRCETEQKGTKLAESDFNVTPSGNVKELQSEGASKTNFADSDFNVADIESKIDLPDAIQQTNIISCSDASVVIEAGTKSNKVDKIEEDDDFEKFATDRVVLDSDHQLPS